MFCRHNPALPVRIDQLLPESVTQSRLLSISADDLIVQEALGAGHSSKVTRAQWHGLCVAHTPLLRHTPTHTHTPAQTDPQY